MTARSVYDTHITQKPAAELYIGETEHRNTVTVDFIRTEASECNASMCVI